MQMPCTKGKYLQLRSTGDRWPLPLLFPVAIEQVAQFCFTPVPGIAEPITRGISPQLSRTIRKK
jgi:hypothetical protein